MTIAQSSPYSSSHKNIEMKFLSQIHPIVVYFKGQHRVVEWRTKILKPVQDKCTESRRKVVGRICGRRGLLLRRIGVDGPGSLSVVQYLFDTIG